jgi:hypothetical protein
MPVMCIGHVRVDMLPRLVPMEMTVEADRHWMVPVRMVAIVVRMSVLMLQRLMRMLVLV